jgi:hypothetical protein
MIRIKSKEWADHLCNLAGCSYPCLHNNDCALHYKLDSFKLKLIEIKYNRKSNETDATDGILS